MTQLELSLRDDARLSSPLCRASELAGDRSRLDPQRSVAGFSTKRQRYNAWRQCRARYRKAKRSHRNQQAAWIAYRDATTRWLAA